MQVSPFKVLWEDGTLTEEKSNSAYEEGWPARRYSKSKGFTRMQMPIARNPLHPVYDLLYDLYYHLGIKNVKVFEDEEGNFLVSLRNGTFDGTKQQYHFLKNHLIDGYIIWKDERILIQSDNIPVNVHFKQKTIDVLIKEKKGQETISDVVERLVQEQLTDKSQS
ncbi:hypothetical protein [Alteribacillus bidgolensis]|uniref:Uncharacterized protein n=1 Tax=Alteribacillus bidgolensis TaxID=930129 RepID=A0A1G8S542_9BACI|nr:hypothetical protein [Alteribacillus bidgolensis]SDJ24384.1 hypothetical protein SAMN05216352_1427 [Alteribacillus bidgolensis]